MEAQGYKLESNTIMQDNQAAIKMECNRKASCTKRFYAKDLVDRKEVTIEYCLTDMMIAIFFTKPLQGALFLKFRDVILGIKPISSIILSDGISSKERIEVNKNEKQKKQL